MKTHRQLILLFIGLVAASQLSAQAPVPASVDATKIVHVDNVIYGQVQGAGLLADIAYPETKEKVPAIISVHGGRWRAGHKRDVSAIKVDQWAGFGFFAMSIDYRLVGCSPVPACYQDFQCAIRYVHANAEKYNIDTRRIFLIGQSAGGHMVSLAATLGDGPWPRTGGWEKADNKVCAVISVAGAYDLPTLSWGNIWTPAGEDPDKARALASSMNHVSKAMTPLLMIHSDNDKSVPIDNALRMVDMLKKAGADYKFLRYPNLGHMGIIDEVITQARAFIKEKSP
jgi:alpha-L-fucosidase 2